ncbi:MAG TPA: methylated-DNA--[protein]-cysteine S-methyltransferase [Terriglobales bacterium]|jgi:methylated-DNA-[protein]-cysteine S-methyltransferase|nr:methylated-DNA--[protein]-cysteine S-methyltransferase [Terriglobales bacterium]
MILWVIWPRPSADASLVYVMETLYYSQMASPVGPLLIGVSQTALVILEFDRGLPQVINGERVEWQESESRTRPVRRQLEEYFAGKRRKFDLDLDLRGTEFRKRCWQELLRIPYGETRSYGEIARAVGNPKGPRAVGQANHYNPIAIIVPCHRVLAGGCQLGGYGGGLPVKAFLLRLEGAEFQDPSAALHESKQLAFSEH